MRLKTFLCYIFWCAFGNHKYILVEGTHTLGVCDYCEEYAHLKSRPLNDRTAAALDAAKLAAIKALQVFKDMGASADEVAKAFRLFGRAGRGMPEDFHE